MKRTNISKIDSRWGKWWLFPDVLIIYPLIKISLYLLLLGVLFCDFGFSKIFHGAGMQMTNNGTGFYYKPGIPLNTNSQVIGDIGFHFDNSIQLASMQEVENNKRSILLNISAGISPFIILQNKQSSDIIKSPYFQ